MGLFDTIKSSYDLGEDFTDKELQTKDILDGIGGTLDFYWINPKGQLFLIDTSSTAYLVPLIDTSSTAYLVPTNKKFPAFKWIPNGTHGKVSPVYITKYVEVYNHPYRRCRIHFKLGVVQDFEVLDLINEFF